MLRFILILTFFLTQMLTVKGQVNLVPNPDFEFYSACPNFTSELYKCNNWFNPTANSPDYYNECCIQPFPIGADVPLNFPGFQYSRSGSGYAGIANIFSLPEQRDYISVQLIDTLKPNQVYCFEYFVCLSEISMYSIPTLGIHFSNVAISDPGIGVLNLTPQYSNTGVLNDTLNWVQVSGEYTAVGGEKFITIGSFLDSTNSGVQQNSWGTFALAYYYIDDVSVYEGACPMPPSDIFIPNVFSPNEDDINDLFRVENLPDNYQMEIYNRWGEIVYRIVVPGKADNNIFTWDGYTMSGIECPDGVYYYVLSLPDQEAKRGTVTILR